MGIAPCCNQPPAGTDPAAQDAGLLNGRNILIASGGLVAVGLALYLLKARQATDATTIKREIVAQDLFHVMDEFCDASRFERLMLEKSGVITDPALLQAIKRVPDSEVGKLSEALGCKMDLEGVLIANQAMRDAGPACLTWKKADWQGWLQNHREAKRWVDLPVRKELYTEVEKMWQAFAKERLGSAHQIPTLFDGPANMQCFVDTPCIDGLVKGWWQPTSFEQVLREQAGMIAEYRVDLKFALSELRPQERDLYERIVRHFETIQR